MAQKHSQGSSHKLTGKQASSCDGNKHNHASSPGGIRAQHATAGQKIHRNA